MGHALVAPLLHAYSVLGAAFGTLSRAISPSSRSRPVFSARPWGACPSLALRPAFVRFWPTRLPGLEVFCLLLGLGCAFVCCRPGAFLCSWFLGVYFALILCWLPLLGACSRRCGSCRPPEVSFGLRLFWCVRLFLALGCVLLVALSRTWIPAGVSL